MNYLIVQLTTDEAILARFRLKGGALTFEGATRESLDKEHPLEALLADAAADAVRDSARVVLALPAGHLYLREMELPISDRRKIKEILPLELRGETALETEGLVFDSLPLTGGKTLAVWCKRDEIASGISRLTAAGIEPEMVTASLFHWHNLLPEEAKTGDVALTDGEALAVYRDGTPYFFRALQGGDTLTQVDATLAALEIGRGIKIASVLLHGNAANVAKASGTQAPCAMLSGNIELEAMFGSEADAARDLAGAYAVARAAALEEPVNFRSGDLAYTAGRKKLLKKMRFSLILGGLLLALLVAETSVRYYLVKRDLDSLNNSISSIYKQVFPSRKKPVDEVAELRSEIKRLGGTSASGGVLLTLKELAEAKGSDVTSIYEVEVDNDKVRVRGEARTIAAANAFSKRAGSFFTESEVSEIKSRPNGSATFLFRGTLTGGGQ